MLTLDKMTEFIEHNCFNYKQVYRDKITRMFAYDHDCEFNDYNYIRLGLLQKQIPQDLWNQEYYDNFLRRYLRRRRIRDN
jgi:hypothetical protein